ncbi:hypothetical protein [Janibacter anophelis]|uniref:hypothetical protein n=1 Tax=Janibacter anophelis TaxID=319054 RepID=UPI000837682E|nr:hypothetical protein [Janibacter anophelis]
MTALIRLARAGGVATALLCLTTTAAHAADGAEPSPLRAADRAAASKAASSGQGLDLARRVATLQQGQASTKGQPHRAPTARVVAGSTTEVHVLARDFVAEGTGPVGELGYVATTARVDDQLVSVWTARAKGGNWRAVNAAAGDLEARMERKAGAGSLLSEPQVGAWYAVHDGRVRPLNASARDVVGAGMTLEEYQQVVHERYADKLPGSAYDRAGTAGGFGDAVADGATGAAAGGASGTQTAALGAGGAALATGGLLAARRRRERA